MNNDFLFEESKMNYAAVLQLFTIFIWDICRVTKTKFNYEFVKYRYDTLYVVEQMAKEFYNLYKNTNIETTLIDYVLHFIENNIEKYFFIENNILKSKMDVEIIKAAIVSYYNIDYIKS